MFSARKFGHTFGLDHNREGATGGSPDDTCMNDQTRPLRYPSPNIHDTELLDAMYEHDHGSSGGGGGGKGKDKCHPKFGCPFIFHATWAEQYDNEQDLYDAAGLIVDATVLASAFDRRVGFGNAAPVQVTRVVLRVNDTFQGDARPVLILEQTRGPNFEIEDDPGYVTGDSYVLYLRQKDDGTFRTVNPAGRIRQ